MDSDPEHSGQDDDSLCRVGNFNSQFARKLTTLEFNDKFSIIVPLRLGGENKKMVREDTNHGDKVVNFNGRFAKKLKTLEFNSN